MRIFTKYNSFEDKVNFVDENDIFIGYDLKTACCEQAYYYITEKIVDPNEIEIEDYSENAEVLEDYVFDIENGISDIDSGIVIKLIAEGKKDLYLHLYNIHNGHYSHKYLIKNNATAAIIDEDVI
jgi:hypothetical protein